MDHGICIKVTSTLLNEEMGGGRGSEYQWIHLFSICIGFGGGLIMKRNLY